MPEPTFDRAAASESWSSEMVRDWLRKPFKPEQIGKLPATQKRPALDFVGHAAVTDRLNKIAPDWSYTVDNMSTIGQQVWIRGTMTIGGVSRPEFGDGADPKEAIGNFIRRAAMRYGVAIDLWSREELESETPSTPAGHGVSDAGGRIENTSSASRDSLPGGTTAVEGEAAADLPGKDVSVGAGDSSLADRASTTPAPASLDQPGPPHYPLYPAGCDHLNSRSKRRLSPRKSPRGPVCPRCGLSYIAIVEGAA